MEGLSLSEARKTEARTSLSKIVKKIALTSKGHNTVYILCSKQSGPVLEDDEYW